MAKALIIRNPRLLDQIIARFEIDIQKAEREEGIRIFRSGDFFVYFAEKIDIPTLKKLSERHTVTDIYFLDFADGAGSEVRIGDIILPSFFLQYDRSVETLEEDRAHFSNIGKEAVFIESYETQGDYDFGEFAMSIGGGVVSLEGEAAPSRPLYSKVSAAYGVDAIDSVSFGVAKAFSGVTPFYAVLCMRSDRVSEISTIEDEKKLSVSAVEICKFLIESTSEE